MPPPYLFVYIIFCFNSKIVVCLVYRHRIRFVSVNACPLVIHRLDFHLVGEIIEPVRAFADYFTPFVRCLCLKYFCLIS